MTPSEFNRLLSRIKKDEKALEKIYDFYYPRIILHIKTKYKDISGEDVAQEFFLNLINTRKFNYILKPSLWVYTSCDNIAKKYLIESVAADLEYIQVEDNSIAIIEETIIDENIKKIFKILKDDVSKKIFYMYYWQGYNLREIAELLDINASTIKQKHTRGIKKIKEKLKIVAKNSNNDSNN